MKVYFAASHRGTKSYHNNYLAIHQIIDELGYTHTDTSLKNIESIEFYTALDSGGHKAYENLYKEKIDHIKDADICIFECSFPSLSIGYQIEKSLEYNKPTIILYVKGQLPYFLKGMENDKLITSHYSLSPSFKNELKNILDSAKHIADKRFNFFISPMQLNYLNNVSRELGVTKSTHIRNLIAEDMHRRNKKK